MIAAFDLNGLNYEFDDDLRANGDADAGADEMNLVVLKYTVDCLNCDGAGVARI